MARIAVDREKIAEFCRKRHVRKLALFGSVLRDDFGPDSDVDVLVEFEPNHIPGLAFFAMENELSEIIGRKVDLNTPGFISGYFLERVLAEAEVSHHDDLVHLLGIEAGGSEACGVHFTIEADCVAQPPPAVQG